MLRKQTTVTLALATLCALLAAAGGAQAIEPNDVKPLDWGSTKYVSHLGSLYFAGQIDDHGIAKAKAAGVKVVVNLRGEGEHDWDEAKAVEGAGMQYFHVPVTGSSFSPEAFAQIEKLVAEHKDDGMLIHCGSSNRVGGWLATHLVQQHEMSLDDALEVGRSAGITSGRIEDRVREYLETQK